MLDPHGVVLTWNAGAERFKGYRADEKCGRGSATGAARPTAVRSALTDDACEFIQEAASRRNR